jgi:hypothetical protein
MCSHTNRPSARQLRRTLRDQLALRPRCTLITGSASLRKAARSAPVLRVLLAKLDNSVLWRMSVKLYKLLLISPDATKSTR